MESGISWKHPCAHFLPLPDMQLFSPLLLEGLSHVRYFCTYVLHVRTHTQLAVDSVCPWSRFLLLHVWSIPSHSFEVDGTELPMKKRSLEFHGQSNDLKNLYDLGEWVWQERQHVRTDPHCSLPPALWHLSAFCVSCPPLPSASYTSTCTPSHLLHFQV